MNRSVLLLLCGAAAGAGATYAWISAGGAALLDRSAVRADSEQADAGKALASAAASTADVPPPTAERLAVYQTAVSADERSLPLLLRNAAAQPPSAARTFTLDALLARYAEIDPQAAVMQVESLQLDAALLPPLYREWARVDAEGALVALSMIADAATARIVALALADVLGWEGPALARIVESLPAAIDAASFTNHVIARHAESAPAVALQRALELSDGRAHEAVRRVAETWGRADPDAAMQEAETIGDLQLREVFKQAVLGEWASVNPGAALDFIADDAASIARTPLMIEIARAEPMRVLALADRLPEPLNQIAPQLALHVLTERDPLAAVAYAEAAPPGRVRQQYLQSVAAAYGAADPGAALEWARSLEPRNPGLVASVLGGIAQEDVHRALDLALAEPERMSRMRAAQRVVMSAAMTDDAQSIAERLITGLDDVADPSLLDTLTSMWASRDPENALSWLLANSDSVGAGVFRQAAQQIAQRDPALAARHTQQVPAEARPQWIAAVAQGYAQTEPDEAVAWIAQFRGEPGYDAAVAAVVQGTAHFDPAGAARLLDGIDMSSQNTRVAAASVASQWAAQDPTAAAAWATQLRSEEARTMATRGIAMQWGHNDFGSARSWVLGLTSGGERDGALTSLMGAVAARGEPPDPTLLAAFSNDGARQRALLPIIAQRGRVDEAEARAWIDDYITDPQVRQQAEQMLSNSSNQRFVIGTRSGSFGVPGPAFLPVSP